MKHILKEQVADALWYLKKPGKKPEDEAKAIDILSSIAFGKFASEKIKEIERVAEPVTTGNLTGLNVALIIGHEPGGGTPGERLYNIKVANILKPKLEALGANVIIYKHKLRRYRARQRAMGPAIKKLQPDNDICIEFHYDAVSDDLPNGHHFQYYSEGGKKLASCFRDQWQRRYPQSKTRRGKTGIYENKSSYGSEFLIQAPGWATLLEPFFRSNEAEWAFFRNRHEEVADVYCAAIIQYNETV